MEISSALQSHPAIALWRQAFQSLNVPTKKYVSSVETMTKRAAKADSKPFSINPLVDLYNAFSLEYLLPFGGFELASNVTEDLKLRFSRGNDSFTALDSEEAVGVSAGEILYAYNNMVVTRHINWRQSKEGLIQGDSADVCFMAEILGGYPDEQVEALNVEFPRVFHPITGVTPEIKMIDKDHPSINL